MLAVFAWVLLRGWGDHLWALYAGTLVAGFGIAVAGTLLPPASSRPSVPSPGTTVTGALRDLTGDFSVIWLLMAVLMLAQMALVLPMTPGLRKVP